MRYTSTNDVWFGRTHGGITYNGTTQLILDNGTIEGGSAKFAFPHALANSSNNSKNVVVKLLMQNGSSISTTADIHFGEVERANSKTEKTLQITAAVTNSSMTAKAVRFGQTNSYISDLDNSFVNASFGPGSDVSCYQFYAFQYPKATVTFDGTTVHWLGGDQNVFGKNSGAVNFEGYRLLSGGVTFDVPQNLTHGSLFGALVGEGGFTKTGSGTLTYERDAFLFTGPLTVSNGVMISSQNMAASAFAVDGASSELRLSGALTNANVTLSATAGGTLTLSGATLPDASPDLTLADGAALGFNFTERTAAPVLSAASATLSGTVNVKVFAADGIRPKSGAYTLTSGGAFADAVVSLVDAPYWVEALSLEDGNIVLSVKHPGLSIFIK